jgi:hypothetical protein
MSKELTKQANVMFEVTKPGRQRNYGKGKGKRL